MSDKKSKTTKLYSYMLLEIVIQCKILKNKTSDDAICVPLKNTLFELTISFIENNN